MTQKIDFEEFIRRVQAVHGDTILINECDYTVIGGPTKATCSKHKIEFNLKSAWSLARSNPCKLCCREVKLKKYQERFNQAIGEYYPDLILIRPPENFNVSTTLRCPKHGDFEAKADSVIFGRTGCKKCAIINSSLSRTGLGRVSFASFKNRLQERYGNNLTVIYGEAEFSNMSSLLTVKCEVPSHKIFFQTARDLLRFQGCRSCNESAGERLVRAALESMGISFEQQKRFPTCRDKKELPFDFWLPQHASIIEFQGKQHQTEAARFGGAAALLSTQRRDQIKNRWAHENGLQLIYISEYSNIQTDILTSLANTSDFRSNEVLDRLKRKNLEWSAARWKRYLTRLNRVHQKRYDFSGSKWAWGERKIEYICSVHGKRVGDLFALLKGHGCSMCAQNEVTLSEVIERSRAKFDRVFEFFPETFVSMDVKMDIGCPVHGSMRISPNAHLRFIRGCRMCGGKALDGSPEKFLTKAKELFLDKFDYSNADYKGADKKVVIKCIKHDFTFSTLPSEHLRSKHGACPRCASKSRSHLKAKSIQIKGAIFPSIIEACKHYGIDRSVVSARIRKGWDVDRAFATPKRTK